MMAPTINFERMLGTGALASVLGMHLPGLESLPPEARSVLLGAIGASLAALVGHAGRALGRVVDAWGRRAARAIDPATVADAPSGAETEGGN